MKPTPKLNLKKLEPHPLGAMFPPMGDEEYDRLKTGMKQNGYDKRHPVILFEGQILEGNNRYTAAKAVKKEPEFKNFEDLNFPGDAIDYVIQENLSRRNLTPSQLATLGAELVEKMEQAEKAEKEAAAANSQPAPKKKKGDKVAAAAKKVGVSARSVASARKVKKADPAAAEDIKAGKKKLHAATQDVDKKKAAEDAKTKEHEEAVARIDNVLGAGWTLKAAESNTHLQPKHILQLSGLEEEEMKRVKPFIEAGWKLKDALGYKSVSLTYAHNIRQLTDRATAQGGTFTLLIDDWVISVEKKAAV